MLPQEESPTHGEGLDQGLAFVLVKALVEEATADRIELLSGRGNELTKLGRSRPRLFVKVKWGRRVET